ncbi:MAG: D-alanyl-D-alanine carboxypeptidase [Actinobacteria bacterium]|nr:D-alanyl-D-alanine carboxypeptidase [Actinomycetota bacterium]NDG68919.1 D-alanyl-D-alanine carboxypeptidase [Actinomycetota bacterium]
MTITLSSMAKSRVAIFLALLLAINPLEASALQSLDKYVNSKHLAAPGLLILNPLDGQVLAANSPDSLRVPASVLKLVSSTAALHFLGAERRYVTSIFATERKDAYLIKGSLDPWMSSNLTLAKKNGQKYLPSLITKANPENRKKITLYYTSLFEKDRYDLSLNLNRKGIKATFKKVDSAKAMQLAKEEIASLTSLPLSEMVKFVTLYSDNTLANRLAMAAAREIGFERTSEGLTKTFVLALEELGVNTQGLKAKDGSGLDKDNRLSAQTVVELLTKVRENPKYQAIYEGLPVAGVSGTLKKRFIEDGPGAVGKVKAKTGWLRNTVTLAGYAKSADKEYVFAILADGINPTLGSRNRARAVMDRLLEAIVMGNH